MLAQGRNPPPLNDFLGLVVCLTMACAGAPARAIEPFSAHYTVTRDGVTVGAVERSLGQDAEGRLTFHSVTKSAGLAKLLKRETTAETSHFDLFEGAARALIFVSQRTGKKPRLVRGEFDWSQGEARFEVNGNPAVAPLTAGDLDPLLYQIRLMQDLARGERRLSYAIVDRGHRKDYRFAFLAEQAIDTPAGNYSAIGMHRDKGQGKGVTFWCAPELEYLPVRVDITDGDSETRAVLTSVIRTPAPAGQAD